VRVLSLVFTALLLAPQQPVFRSGVDLATLDVTVVDKDGQPIPGLKPEDFVVTLNRQARPVRALDFIETGVVSSTGTDSAPTPATKANPGAPSTRMVLILFDDLSYKPGSGRGLIQAGLRLLPSFGAGDMIGLATTSGLGPKVNPTRDHTAIATALQSKTLVGRDTDSASPFYIAIDEAFEIERGFKQQTLKDVITRECAILTVPAQACPSLVENAGKTLARASTVRTENQVAAYMAAIAALKPAPAPRVIIALTAGLALDPEQGDLQRQLEPVTHAASDAGVEFYALSDLADDVDPRDVTPERARARRTEGGFLDAGIQTLASAAGGETFRVVGTADRFFGRILNETSGFYRLGIELPEAHGSQRYFTAKVSVVRSGAVVRTHTEAIATAVAAPPSAPPTGGAFDDQLRGALERGNAVPGVPISVTTMLRRDPNPGGQLQLAVGAQVPASVRAPFTAMFALTNDTGGIVKEARVSVPPAASGPDYLLTFPIALDSGAYQLRFAVADAAGTIGMVTRPVAARLARIGAYSASELLKTWTDSAGASHPLLIDTLPQAAVSVLVGLELYPDDPATASTGLSVRLSLMSTTAVGEESPIVTKTFVPVRNGQTLSMAADMPASTLPDGIYVIHAVVLQDGAAVGEVSSSIQKLPSSGGRP
jgi:VWFA-related protein